MNERILELNAQADKHAWEKIGKKYDGTGDLNWQWEDTKMAKFAELIVRECMSITYGCSTGPGVHDLFASEIIAEHFGVEE